MRIITPPIGAAGIFDLKDPFHASQSTVYKVEAHRTFTEMLSNNLDPVELVYNPVGLTEADFQLDAGNPEILIVVLVSTTGDRVLVPNRYIVSYPNSAVIPHAWMVATISLGVLPLDFDFQRVKDAIAATVSDYIGVEPSVFIAAKRTHDVVTDQRALELEQMRQAAITYRSTERADKLQLEAENLKLKDQVSYLINLLEEFKQAECDPIIIAGKRVTKLGQGRGTSSGTTRATIGTL